MGLPNYDLPADGALYDGLLNQAARDALKAELLADLSAQVDDPETNTDPTDFTPRYVGDTLIGEVGGDPAIWIAVGLTEDDWIQVDQVAVGT